jgi:hypothetical protein
MVAKQLSRQVFGTPAGSIYDIIGIFHRSGQEARTAIVHMIRDGSEPPSQGWLRAGPSAESSPEGWIGVDRATWLSQQVGQIAQRFPYLGQYWRNLLETIPTDWQNIARLALLQRVHAYGMVATNAAWLVELAVSLPISTHAFYDQQLFLSDLVVRVTEED